MRRPGPHRPRRARRHTAAAHHRTRDQGGPMTTRPSITDTTIGRSARRAGGVRTGLRRLHQLASRDDGSATVEFVFLAVVILVPLIYVVLTVSMLQRAAFA